MTSVDSSPPDPQSPPEPAKPRADHGPILLTALMMLGVAWLIANEHPILTWQPGQPLPWQVRRHPGQGSNWVEEPLPLVMNGGDPHLRALMRTISAAESNVDQPYHVLYGGQTVEDLSQHPDLCITIVAGPNRGNCTTAAGRYQFLTTTWTAKADLYHPRQVPWWALGSPHSFEPEYQDQVVYHWLSDDRAWGVDIPDLLRQGRLEEVLAMLSGTWTSLGYGIEDNVTTPYLADIYQGMLQQELNGG